MNLSLLVSFVIRDFFIKQPIGLSSLLESELFNKLPTGLSLLLESGAWSDSGSWWLNSCALRNI